MEIGKFHRDLLFHHPKNYSAQYRTPNRSNAANDRHEKNRDTGLEGKNVTGIKERRAAGIDAAGNASKTSGDRVDP